MWTPTERLRWYRLRAEETRTAAENMRPGVNRATLLRIARDYDVMADNLEPKVRRLQRTS
jgi:hypothetical protein